ncbi:MAG: inositol monophosphatase [Demequina sp.]|nr:inositol monophosphatase [Demequina sp.]
MTNDPAELLRMARELALEAGRLIADRQREAHITATKSSGVDIVTQVDLASERLLRERIAGLRPGDGILGEEGQDVPGSSGITWVIDPIDGTVNYLYGLPSYAVSVAAVTGPARSHEWTTLAGAVFDGSGRLWSAGRGLGAWRDGEALHKDGAPPLAESLVGTGFQYVARSRAAQGQFVAKMLPQVRDIRRLGAAAVDLCLVAAGHLDAYYEHGLHAWDFAAGSIIASEAGVKVAGIDGGAPDEHLVIAAHPAVWNELRDALETAGARELLAAP